MKLIVLTLTLILVNISGCSLFHHETPQQQFIQALNRGNGPEASQIWLHMTPEQKQAFAHSQGMHPAESPKDIYQDVLRKAQEQAEGGESEQPSVTGGSGLQDLPEYANPAAAPAAPGPDQSEQ